jgi:hypothetical protein
MDFPCRLGNAYDPRKNHEAYKMKHKKVYRGWIDPHYDLPVRGVLRNAVMFWSQPFPKYHTHPCKITVEWIEKWEKK